MANKDNENFMGITPIIVFVVLIAVTGGLANDFTAMPLLVGFMIASGYALMLNPKGKKVPISEKLDLFCRGAGEKTIILLVLVFLMAGAFYALTIEIGARDSVVNNALKFVPLNLLLPGLFMISCFISFSMGTSMGTVTAIAPIGIGLAEKIGVPIPLTMGIVIGGALFGDNLSFISDTTIAATRTQGVRLKDKFKANALIVLPAAIVTCTILLTVDVNISSGLELEPSNVWLTLPYFLIIVTALYGLNVITVLSIGMVSAGVTGLVTGSFDGFGMLKTIQSGMASMEDLAVIALIIGGIMSLMKLYGGIDWLLNTLTKRVKTKSGAELSIASLSGLVAAATANNTVTIVSVGPIARQLNDKYQIDPRRTASILDIFACGVQGMMPYGGQLLTCAALAGISPLSIMPYCWYSFIILTAGIIAILTGFPRFKDKALDDSGNPVLSIPEK